MGYVGESDVVLEEAGLVRSKGKTRIAGRRCLPTCELQTRKVPSEDTRSLTEGVRGGRGEFDEH